MINKIEYLEKIVQEVKQEIIPYLEELKANNEKLCSSNDEITSLNLKLEYLSLVAQNTHELVIITNAKLKIEWVNQGFVKLTGYTLEEVIGKNPRFLQGKDTNPAHKEAIKRGVKAKQSFSQEILNYSKTGQPYWLLVSITPIFDDKGEVKHFIAIESDITKQKRLEEELRQFSYIVSHNVRSSIANILGLLDVFPEKESFTEQQLHFIDLIQEQAQNLDLSINEVNEVLALQDKRHKLKSKFLITEILKSIEVELRPTLVKLQARIQYNIQIDEIESIKSYFHSILYNLISNALKYSDSQRNPEISIEVLALDKNILFMSVQDNGQGIDLAKYKNTIFKMYKRINHEVKGRGLGLYMVRAQVEALRGTIEVESILGVGSKFLITIPLMNSI